MTAPDWQVRPALPSDREFLLAVYASVRQEELAVTGWSEDVKASFLRSQFVAQDTHYRQAYPDARFDVILVDGVPAGRLYVARLPDQIRIVDIALLPSSRGHGLGTALLTGLFDEARANGLPVTIHVEHENRARRLYQRLGFEEIEQRGLYVLMAWRPEKLPEEPAGGSASQPKTAS